MLDKATQLGKVTTLIFIATNKWVSTIYTHAKLRIPMCDKVTIKISSNHKDS